MMQSRMALRIGCMAEDPGEWPTYFDVIAALPLLTSVCCGCYKRTPAPHIWAGNPVDAIRGSVMTVKTGWEGRFFEDFEVGDIYRSRIGRTITQADNIWFTLLTNNTNQIHFNEHFAERTQFKRPLVNSTLTIAIVAGLGVTDTSENGFALGWDEIRMPNPLFEGDTLYSESEVVDKRESQSNLTRGIVKFRSRGIKQDGTVVLAYTRSVMIWKREHAPIHDLFPEVKE